MRPSRGVECPGSVTVTMEYLLICFSILILWMNFLWKTGQGEAESIVLLIFALWRCFNRQWISGGGVGQKILFRGSWHPIKHDTFWHVLTGYFFVLFLWAIAVSDFCSWEIHKNFSLPSFAIIFTVNNHKDNHFYKWYASNIIQYEISFFTEIHVKVFYNHKNHGLQKKLYRKNSFLLL